MFSSNNGYSLADIAAVTGSNNNGGFFGGNGWGGDGWWILLLFLFGFGGWGNGGWFGNGGNSGVNGSAFQGALTRADLTDEINFSDLDHAVRDTRVDLSNDYHNLSTNIIQGICDLNGTINNGVNSINTNLSNLGYQLQSGINDVNVNSMQNTYAIGSQITALGNQMSSCCCDMRYQIEKGFSDLNYNIATSDCATRQAICDSTRDIIDSQNANTRAILDRLTNDKMADLRDENQALKFAASQAAQNNYLVDQLRPCPIPAYNVPNPYCCNGYYNSLNY